MKKLINIAVMVFFITVSANAMESKDLVVSVNENQVLLVELENVENGVVLSLQDQKGEIFFKDIPVVAEDYRKALSFEMIPMGTYLLSVENDESIVTTLITKSPEGLEVGKDSRSIIFKPFFKVKEDRVLVSLTNPGEKAASFKVYDASGVLVGSANGTDMIFKKSFDFSEVPPGEYTFTVKVGERSFTKTLEIS